MLPRPMESCNWYRSPKNSICIALRTQYAYYCHSVGRWPYVQVAFTFSLRQVGRINIDDCATIVTYSTTEWNTLDEIRSFLTCVYVLLHVIPVSLCYQAEDTFVADAP